MTRRETDAPIGRNRAWVGVGTAGQGGMCSHLGVSVSSASVECVYVDARPRSLRGQASSYVHTRARARVCVNVHVWELLLNKDLGLQRKRTRF